MCIYVYEARKHASKRSNTASRTYTQTLCVSPGSSGALCGGLGSPGAPLEIAKSLETRSVIQRQLDFLKAVRFGRCVLNELVSRASCEALYSLGRILVF